MDKPLIVFTDGCDSEIFQKISANANLNIYPKSKVTFSELKTLLPEVSGLVIRSATEINSDLLELAPKLKYIVRAGEGTDNIDLKTCHAKEIKVSNTPGANANSAAEHAIALMMSVMRNIAHADSSMKNGIWNKDAYTGLELWNKTIGIMGFGRVGQMVAKRLSGFEPTILFFDPLVHQTNVKGAIKVNSLDELFSKSDIVTIHTPLVESIKGIVNEKLLSKMKSNSILINAARGKIINEEDLYTALKNKKIRGAGLDVFAKEPLDTNSKLKELDNVVLTPHIGWSTEEAQARVGELAAHLVVEFFVNKRHLYEVR